jgi:hypothetical protein
MQTIHSKEQIETIIQTTVCVFQKMYDVIEDEKKFSWIVKESPDWVYDYIIELSYVDYLTEPLIKDSNDENIEHRHTTSMDCDNKDNVQKFITDLLVNLEWICNLPVPELKTEDDLKPTEY